jgi:hypothetical protein
MLSESRLLRLVKLHSKALRNAFKTLARNLGLCLLILDFSLIIFLSRLFSSYFLCLKYLNLSFQILWDFC